MYDNHSSQDGEEEEYQPTDQEIIDYARFLGMNLPEDQDLLYIAEEGVSYQLIFFSYEHPFQSLGKFFRLKTMKFTT